MALNFAADGNLVDHASGIYDIHDGTHSAGTVFILFRPTDDTARQSIFNHLGGGSSVGEYGLNWRADVAGDNFESFRQAAVYNGATAAAANFAAYSLNNWLYFAVVWNTAGSSTDQKMYMGSRTLPMAEPSSYVSRSAGSGTVGTGNGAFRVGNGAVTTREFKGDIAYVTIVPAVLTLEQLIRLQYTLKPPVGNRLDCHYGFPGTSSIDRSGNANHGAVTGATAVAHAPIAAPFGRTSGWRGNSVISGAPPPTRRIFVVS